MKIGDKISSLRKQKGLNRDELGKIIGTSRAVIGKYERDEITKPERECILLVMDSLLRDAQINLTHQKLA